MYKIEERTLLMLYVNKHMRHWNPIEKVLLDTTMQDIVDFANGMKKEIFTQELQDKIDVDTYYWELVSQLRNFKHDADFVRKYVGRIIPTKVIMIANGLE